MRLVRAAMMCRKLSIIIQERNSEVGRNLTYWGLGKLSA